MIIALTLVIVAHIALTRSVFCRYIIAIGTNETAARISGIETKPYTMIVLALSGARVGAGFLCRGAIIAVLQNGLAQMGVSESVIRLITGGVIIAAVLIDRWR